MGAEHRRFVHSVGNIHAAFKLGFHAGPPSVLFFGELSLEQLGAIRLLPQTEQCKCRKYW